MIISSNQLVNIRIVLGNSALEPLTLLTHLTPERTCPSSAILLLFILLLSSSLSLLLLFFLLSLFYLKCWMMVAINYKSRQWGVINVLQISDEPVVFCPSASHLFFPSIQIVSLSAAHYVTIQHAFSSGEKEASGSHLQRNPWHDQWYRSHTHHSASMITLSLIRTITITFTWALIITKL